MHFAHPLSLLRNLFPKGSESIDWCIIASGERLSFEWWTDADGGDAGDADADVMGRRNG